MGNLLSKETVSVGVLAILAGLVGAYGIRAALQSPPPEQPARPELLKVPMATSDLPAGRLIVVGDVGTFTATRDQLAARNLPLDQVMLDAEQVIGRRVREPIRQGQAFLTASLYLAGTGPNVAEKLKPGYRAVSVSLPLDQLGGVAPGLAVDVFFRANSRPGSKGAAAIPEVTVNLLHQMDVLDVEHSTTAGEKNAQVILAVPADQVAMIRAVEGRGEFSLVPRPRMEMKAGDETPRTRTTLEEALGIPPPSPEPQPFQTAIYRRTAVQTNLFVANALVDQHGAGNCPGCKRKDPTPVPPDTLQPQPDPGTQQPTLAPPKAGHASTIGDVPSPEPTPVYSPVVGGHSGQRPSASIQFVAPKRHSKS